MKLVLNDVLMNNGHILKAEKIDKMVKNIINQLADEGLSVEEGKEILNRVEKFLGEFSSIKKVD